MSNWTQNADLSGLCRASNRAGACRPAPFVSAGTAGSGRQAGSSQPPRKRRRRRRWWSGSTRGTFNRLLADLLSGSLTPPPPPRPPPPPCHPLCAVPARRHCANKHTRQSLFAAARHLAVKGAFCASAAARRARELMAIEGRIDMEATSLSSSPS